MPALVIVPDQYPTIQGGVNAVDNQGEVQVRAGLYSISVNIIVPTNKTVTCRAIDGLVQVKETTVDDGFSVQDGAHLILDGDWELIGTGGTKTGSEASCGIKAGDSLGARVDILGRVVCRSWADHGLLLRPHSTSQSTGILETHNTGFHGVLFKGCDLGGYFAHLVIANAAQQGLHGVPLSGFNTMGWVIDFIEAYSNGEKGIYWDTNCENNTVIGASIHDNGVNPIYAGQGILVKANYNIFGALLDPSWITAQKASPNAVVPAQPYIIRTGVIESVNNGAKPVSSGDGITLDEGASYCKILNMDAHANRGSNISIGGAQYNCNYNEVGWCHGDDAIMTWAGRGLNIETNCDNNYVHDSSFSGNAELDISVDGSGNVVTNCYYVTSWVDTGNFVDPPTPPIPPALQCSANGPYSKTIDDPTVSFQGSALNGQPPYAWLWDFGDGTTSSEQNPVHAYPAAEATYLVTLTVTDALAAQVTCSTTATVTSVAPPPPPTPQLPGWIVAAPIIGVIIYFLWKKL